MSDLTPNLLTCPGVPELPAPDADQPSSKRRIRRWAFAFACLAFFILVAPLVYGGVRAGAAAWRIRQELSALQANVERGDFQAAEDALPALSRDAGEVRAGLQAVGAWRSAPWIGPQIRGLEETARVGESVVGAVGDILDVFAAVQEAYASATGIDTALETGVEPTRRFRDLAPDEKRDILSRLSDGLPKLRGAREKLQIALERWNRIPQDEFSAPVRRALEPFAKHFPELARRADQGVSFLEVFLPLAGYPTPKSYLVVLQNADELRPTGGFLGTVGVLKVDAADVRQVQFDDVYAIDDPVAGRWTDVPPDILRRELGVKAWYFRDSNWSPDFPQTAERLLDVYGRERQLAGAAPERFDGVLAFQPGFFRELLRLTGPIKIEDKTFNADNFFDQLQYDVEIGFREVGIPTPQRKEIVERVGQVLLATLMDQPSSRWGAILDTASRSLERKDILIYARDPRLLSILDARNWSGRTRTAPQDFLEVVDANLAALKTDGVTDKEIKYVLDAADPTGPVATVTLVYRNNTRRITWRETRYRDYVRVYVPEGSELLESQGAMLSDITRTGRRVIPGRVDVFRDLGKTAFGAFWSIEPGETRTLTFRYRLPPDLRIGQGTDYRLLAQKQPGRRSRLTLDLAFGKKLLSAAPAEDPKDFGDNRYRLSQPFDGDSEFSIRLAE